jgi:hypothetical protein
MKVKIKCVRCTKKDSIEHLTTILTTISKTYSKITIENLHYVGHGVKILLKMIESKNIFIEDLYINIMNYNGDDLSNTWNKLCTWLQVWSLIYLVFFVSFHECHRFLLVVDWIWWIEITFPCRWTKTFKTWVFPTVKILDTKNRKPWPTRSRYQHSRILCFFFASFHECHRSPP